MSSWLMALVSSCSHILLSTRELSQVLPNLSFNGAQDVPTEVGYVYNKRDVHNNSTEANSTIPTEAADGVPSMAEGVYKY